MKNFELSIICALLILISTSLVFSCNKEDVKENIDKVGNEKMQKYYEGIDRNPFGATARGRGNPNQFYFTCAASWGDQNEIGNKGLAAEVDIVKFRLGNAQMKSWWIAMTAIYTNSAGDKIRDWSQFGYAVDKGIIFPAYYRYRWNLTKNTGGNQVPPTIIYAPVNVPLDIGTRSRFEMKNIEGTTWWAFSRSGQEVFRADLEVTEMTGHLEACTESWGNATFGPATMTYYMDVYKNGQWNHVPTGVSNQYAWGVQGQYQRPEFIQSQFVMGGNTPLTVDTDPWLWFPN